MADQGPVSSTMFAPVDPGRRNCALDVLRGVALLGIFSMNVADFAAPYAAYSNPTLVFPYEDLNRWTYWVVHTLFDMKMMSIFSMLFGASVIMYGAKATERLGEPLARWLWIRRMLWLMVIGLVHAYLIWEGDILVTYAGVGLILMWWVRELTARVLVALSGVFLVVSLAGVLYLGSWVFVNAHPDIALRWGVPEQTVEEMVDEDAFEAFRHDLAPDDEAVADWIELYQGGWLGIFKERISTTMQIHFVMFPITLFWRVGSMMLLGAALYKTGVLTGDRRRRFYLVWMLVFYAIGLPIVIGGILYNESNGFDLGWFNLVGTMFNAVGSVFVALGHVGLVNWLLKLGAFGAGAKALAAVGRMALTNYLFQSIIASLLFHGYGLGLYGLLDRFEQQLVVLGVWACLLIWSPLWLARFRYGPAEWLWRSLTYMRPQPMRAAR